MKKRIIALFMAAVMMMGAPMPVNAAEVETTEQGDYLEKEFIDNFFKKDSENTEQEEEAPTEEKESEDVSEEELETEEVEEEEAVKEESEEESKEEAINKVESIKLVDWNADKKPLDSVNVTESKYEGDYRDYDTSVGVTYQVVGIVMYDAEDNQVSVSDANIEASDVAYEVVKKVDDSYEVVSDEASPVKLVKEDGEVECLVDGKTASENEFYLQATLKASEYTEECTVTVPIVVAENPSNSFVEPATYCATKEEAYAAVRDIITNRVNKIEDYRASNYRSYQDGAYVYDRIAVNADAVADSELSLLDICDFYEEREDMNAWEGDYILGYIGSNNAVDFAYNNPSIYTENDELLEQVTTDDATYNVYEIYLPVMTTKAQEEAVDKKIEELKATEFEGYDLWLNEDKIKAIYDYLEEIVADDADVNGTNPTYHTAYSVLVDGIGTADAYALAFTRLSRELGVKSRAIMGVDSGAHAYNIVELDEGFWYFLDCSAGIYLTGTSFERAEELERYSDERFVKNYLKLIVKDNLLGAAVKYISVSAVKSLTDSTVVINSTGFDTWADAVKFINTQNKNYVYTIKLNDKVEVTGKLTFPKAALVKVTSDPNAKKKLIYSGDIAPSCDVAFSNVILATDNKKAKLVAGTHKVEFSNVTSNEFATVTATGAGQLILNNSKVVSTGAISLSNLKMAGGQLISNTAGITVSNLADLKGAKIDVKTTVSFKNIISNDGNNSITYGTDYKNTFNITGTINADKTPSQMQVSVGSKKINVSTYALSIVPKYLSANGYKDAKQYENKTIVTAKQVPACYVVIGKSGSTIKHALRKSHDALVLDLNPDRAVELIENGNITLGRFDTLTEAVNEIVKTGNATKSYKLKIYTDIATKADKKPSTELDNLIIPANAKDVTIESANGVYGLKLNNTITLKTDLTLTNLKFEDHFAKNGTNVKLNFNLGKSKLTLNNVTVNRDSDRIGRIFGDSVTGTSALILNGAGSLNSDNKLNLIVTGNLENVGEVNLKSSSLAVLGKTNIGLMTCKGIDLPRVFVGSANVTTKKVDGQVIVTSVKSNVTINEIYSEILRSEKTRNLAFSLIYYSGKNILNEIDGYDASMFTRAKAGFQILKGVKVSEKLITYVDDFEKIPETYVDRKKNGALYLVDPATGDPRYELRLKNDPKVDSLSYKHIAYFDTLKEAVNEIDAIKDPNATYDIHVNNKDIKNYEPLPMPKAGCAKGLIIGRINRTEKFYLTNTSINPTCNLYFYHSDIYTKKPLSFNIGTHELHILNSYFINEYDWKRYEMDLEKDIGTSIIKSITGAGETKVNKDGTKPTVLLGAAITLTGSFTKVGCLQLGDTDVCTDGQLYCMGAVSVGEVKYAWSPGKSECELIGGSDITVSRNKVTKVTSKINIINGIQGFKTVSNDVPKPLNIELGLKYKGVDDFGIEQLNEKELQDYLNLSLSDSLLNGDKLSYELFKTKNAMFKDKDGNLLFKLGNRKESEIIRKGDKFYCNTKALQTVPGYTVKNASGETAGAFINYADAVATINNVLPAATKYTIIANKEDATKQHKAETYTIPSAKKAPQFELQGSGQELNYLGRTGMTFNVADNQKVTVVNTKFRSDGKGNKPVNISVGKSSEFKATETTIDNLKNITGKSAAAKGVVSFSPQQLYTGTLNGNVISSGLKKK
ncbi:Transglutaminase-like superfamily protein [Pseudobutyrivibrio sp. OR37]|uniref:transglutaminase domain-containing protein n=1 Tax=Pseudobutyrivibrio sp. OR37 TaxID=1798186 RepID=UPI0008EB07A2|nr:transglutaminase domain-containing protein [Pseudobutyrivibrio sp. OR37]SFI09944.1 Transglutaminase-like superfamily protein [Pseudobutyrivibrio sp. OR37]